MSELVLDAKMRQRVLDDLTRALEAFYGAEKRREGGTESVNWQGHLSGFRYALRLLLGGETASEIEETVRTRTKLEFPQIGPVVDDKPTPAHDLN
jgi:hypothetical protein